VELEKDAGGVAGLNEVEEEGIVEEMDAGKEAEEEGRRGRGRRRTKFLI
jgi:hypothetical protein